ncbi:hypothetical protein [Xenophilus sp. Marseille-Q4582]|uniref:hypothetical protein n=1 Tax=Xenophilus sp. Marseille-Q4582 TaxID=2866600 RepID=UPI001CE4648D|nr:hypothetical protein [Xenophilus sp. Marseille-Q4582]
MLDTHALRQICPFVATPTHSGALSSLYVRSLLAFVNEAWNRGMALQTRFLDGDSLIPRARNRLERETGRDLSEGGAFCRRWQALGGKVHVDTRSRLAHQGLQTWQGDLPRALLARHPG